MGVIVWKGELVLLGERIEEHTENCWQFPGGHLESGESVIECAMREVREETGLRLSEATQACYTNELFHAGDRQYITLYVSGRWQGGEPEPLEPGKCARWQWFHYRDLPQPLFQPIRHLLQQEPDLRSACS